MNISEFFENHPQLKQYLLPLGIGTLGLGLVAFGIISTLTPSKKQDISFQTSGEVMGTSSAQLKVKEIVVDVEGSVAKPGVYHLSTDARLQEALNGAGGLSEDADRTFVEKKINLAAKLVDGAKIYIPKIGEVSSVQADTTSLGSTTDATAIININEASADQLDALQGVGQVTAQKIINGRPYNDIQDLLNKKIVSTKVFNAIKDKVTVF